MTREEREQLMNDYSRNEQTEDFQEWKEKEFKKAELRLHCDLNTREGRTNYLLDCFDQLGLCVCCNGIRDENGKLVYDENGEIVLEDGETEPIYFETIDMKAFINSFKHEE